MGIYKAVTGKEALKELVKQYDLEHASLDTLINFFSELFDLESKELNLLQKMYLNGKIQILVKKYNIKKL